MQGRIVKALSGFYYVKTQAGTFQCRARGIFKKEGRSPLVGDFVEMTQQDAEEGVVEDILPRKNAFIRPPISNIDLFVTTVSVRSPAPNPEIIDRFLAAAEAADVESIVCINKVDLEAERPVSVADTLVEIYEGIYPVVCVSAATGEGLDALRAQLKGRCAAFAGPSGVGKSSLIALLTGRADLKTDDVSRKTGRGKNTTRHTEIFETDFGAEVFDTPGYTSFEYAQAAGSAGEAEERLDELFPDIARYKGGCRFDDCRHVHEPDCAVRAAAEAGKIAASRYASYVKMIK